jgi:LysR family hydrogen peroxide-inducible transcriptional activator
MQVRELEKQLGVELVERRPNEVTFTDLGAEVARRAERLLAEARGVAKAEPDRQGLLAMVEHLAELR